MPVRVWNPPRTVTDVVVGVRREREAGALVGWTEMIVDGLHFLLDDFDRVFGVAPPATLSHNPHIVEAMFVRSSSISGISAIDACVAALGRWHSSTTRNLSLAQVRPRAHDNGVSRRRAQLPAGARRWISDTYYDPGYKVLKRTRDAMAHERLIRQIAMAADGTTQWHVFGPRSSRWAAHTHSEVRGYGSRELVQLSRDVAGARVEAFYAEVAAGAA